ncbi:MAG TPA: PQQ-dependent sugar dehydrogenase [Thermoanaerobaculia bacterium]|jgi:glucose/arabinose dehydrogenase|nr:PQQ-dependent sugar dehydrogenase [Thermoanaerobaculia bacterium]
MSFRASLLAFLACLPLRAATLPPDFTETLLARGIVRPTAMALAPDGRIFVCEQTGALRVIKDGELLPQPFVTVPVFTEGERGLLGVTVDPDFPRTPHVYVYYTATKPIVHNRVSRFTASGDRAANGSETAILDLPQLAKPIHNGGAMHFGPDGHLYIAVGENAVPENAQNLDNPLGKILRIGKDGSIPPDNPFSGRAIWAYGLRNPFSFAFQPGTGRMFINDVGRKDWEEINEGEAGANYGWPVTEGPTNDPAYRGPLYTYRHGPTPATGCAISGGAFYDPAEPQFPSEHLGSYFFADFCSGWIRRLDPATKTAQAFATDIGGPIGLQVGDDGSLYYLAYEDGTVYRIDFTGNPAPRITAQPEDLKVTLGATATFTVGASGAPPLRYQWQKNGVDIPGATSPSYTLKAEESATFDVVVSNDQGSATSDPAILTVVTDQPPVPRITAPSSYQGGQTIAYSGDASDPEDGPLPASALTWRIDFHHAEHFHPFVPDTPGIAGGTFTVPTIGETSSDVWFRIHLTVKDSEGLTGTTFVDVLPQKVRLTFLTDPPGLQILLDGTPRTAPFTEEAVVGLLRTIGAAEPVTWSDGGAAIHEITTPAADTTYTAVFQATGTQHGLMAAYFDDRNLSQPVLTRIDPNVDFQWGQGSPAPGIGKDTFSVLWTGRVEARVTGPHTFLVRADNGARLWIDGKPLQNRGTIQLEAGKRYDVRLEYFENRGAAMVQLLWSAPGVRRQVVPESQLTP